MSALFIYYKTGYMFFLYILSNEKTRILSKATDTNSQWPQQGSPPTIPRLTTDLLRMKWWNESQEEAEPSTLQQVPDLRWHNYVHMAAFICSSGRGTKISQRLWIPQMCNICCWADLLAGLVFFFFSFYLQSRRGKFFTLPLFTADLQIREAGE